MVQTAGFMAPLSINLRFGFEEIVLVFLVNLTGFLAAIFLADKFYKSKVNGMILFLLMLVGMNGLIMTRDLFNIFVFLEILSISTYSLIAIEKNRRSLSAGFKYMLAGGIASAFILLGIIFLYRFTGTLNLDQMINSSHLLIGKAGFLAIFLVLFAILLELKPFPANGWALDVYEAVNEGLVSLIAVASSAAIFYVLYKFLPLLPTSYLPYLSGVGLFTFFFSNLVGIKQNNPNRLLGYSSIAQMGLLLAIVALLKSFGDLDYLILPIAGGIFLNHFFAKAGLFWLVGIVKKDRIENWQNLAVNPNLLLLFGIFILALTGFPPFPGFWAKWDFLKILSAQSAFYSLGIVLLGSLFEVFYLFRWLGFALRRTEDSAPINSPLHREIAPALFAIILLTFALASAALFRDFRYLELLPIVALIIIYLVDYLPVRFKGWLALLIVGYYGYLLMGFISGLEIYFALVLIAGSMIQITATMYKGGTRKGFYPFLVMMILALGNLVIARSYLSFFFAWELMTIASYFLIIRGKTAMMAGLKYILFSMAAAYLILAGFMLAPELLTKNVSLLSQIAFSGLPLISMLLLAAGFLIKTAALGVHIWLPDAYSEAEDDTTSFLSSILSKSGILGIFLVVLAATQKVDSAQDLFLNLLGWLGVATALGGAIVAVFQEDIKRIVAWSSISQLGYIVLAFAALNHLGWLSALHLTLNHMLFKLMILLAFAGVIMRTGKRNMYEMGGLIKQMPWSFISVLVAIITISGVPPLSGFGSKWLLYNSLIEKGWYFQAAASLFASAIAFLYLFRLIYTVFLGQAKQQNKHAKPAPLWLLIPQYIGLFSIMLISMKPKWILQPLSRLICGYVPCNISWVGDRLVTQLGYWNGFMVMNITMVIFALPFLWLLIITRKVQKVKQFNIVFAAERPDRPETTHFAHNMYAHYNRVMGWLVTPKYATRFWRMIGEWVNSSAAILRNFYSGNGQTYILQIILYFLVLYAIMGGK
jgi:formate hydrogenlyase subunit 3/multisubunit Na+/H+ antiporter MnhD subunit